MSTILNYYDSSFGYCELERIKNVMPWIVGSDFDKNAKCLGIAIYDIDQNLSTRGTEKA